MPAAALACATCVHQPPPWRTACCAVDYGFPWSQLVAQFKYQDRPEHARLFSRLLCDRLRQQADPGAVDCVVPVPLDTQRLRERGYNQAWEIARRLTADRCQGHPALPRRAAPEALLRAPGSAHQAELTRSARQANLAGIFSVNPRELAALQGRRIALVDDVMTTGATFAEATRTLLSAGAAEVHVWSFARTPSPAPD